MRLVTCIKTAIAFVLFSYPLSSLADDKKFETITVTATRTARPVSEVAGSISVLDVQQIERQLGRDIRDLIRYEPGVSVSGGGRFGLSGFTIRGIGGDRVLTQVDGIATMDEFSFGPFLSSRRDFVDIDALKTAEIIRGPASSLYGSDALGGVVSFITKDADDYLEQTDNPYYLSAKSGFSSADDSLLSTVTLAGGKGAMSGLLLYTYRGGNETSANAGGDGEDTGPGRGKADPLSWHSHNVLGKLTLDVGRSHRIRLGGEFFQDAQDTNVLSGSGVRVRGALTNTSLAEDSRQRYRLSLEHEYEGQTLFFERSKLKLYLQNSETKQDTRQERISRGIAQRRSRLSLFNQDKRGLDVQFDKSLTASGIKHTTIYGASYQATDSSSIRDGGTVQAMSGAPLREFFAFPTRDFPLSETEEYAFFLQHEAALFDKRLSLTAGLRYDSYALAPKADTVFLAGNPGAPEPASYKDEQLSFKAGLVFHISDKTSVYGQFAQGFRAPPFDDVNRAFVNIRGGYITLPNPDLVSESSDSYELGLRVRTGHGKLSLAGFFNTYDNFIDSGASRGLNPRTRLLEFQPINREKVQTYGLEARGEWDIGAVLPMLQGLGASASFAYAYGQDKTLDRPLNSIDPMRGVLGLFYRQGERWRGELVMTAVQRKTRTADPDYFIAPGFVSFDLLGEYRLNEKTYFNVGLFNLTDKKYWEYGDIIARERDDVALPRFTRPGRNASVTFRYVF